MKKTELRRKIEKEIDEAIYGRKGKTVRRKRGFSDAFDNSFYHRPAKSSRRNSDWLTRKKVEFNR